MARGGPRKGAGRRPGSPNARSAIDAIRAVADRHPDWHPLTMMADVANDTDLPIETRLDACKSAARWMVPPPKPVELEPDALVDLERRLIQVRLEAQDQLLHENPGLADRLRRAKEREIVVITGIGRAPDDDPMPEPAIDGLAAALDRASVPTRLSPPEEPTRAPAATPAGPAPAPAVAPQPPKPYEPISPVMADRDYNPFSIED